MYAYMHVFMYLNVIYTTSLAYGLNYCTTAW